MAHISHRYLYNITKAALLCLLNKSNNFIKIGQKIGYDITASRSSYGPFRHVFLNSDCHFFKKWLANRGRINVFFNNLLLDM